MLTSYRELHSRPTLNVLSQEQIEQIHLATMAILERTGVRITHPKALEMLDGAGASVNGDRVRIPARMVEEAIQTSPSRFALGKRNGEPAIFLEDNKSWFGAGLDCVDYLDPTTDERRRFTSKDCRVTARISNALSNYSWAMTLGLAADVPADIADRVTAKQALTYCEKPLFFCCQDPDSVRAIYDMAVLIAGSEERFRQAPTIAAISSAISPLWYEKLPKKWIAWQSTGSGIPAIEYPA